MSVEYTIDYSEVEKLQKKMERIPGNVENLINSYLHKEGNVETVTDITELIKISRPTPGAKEHRPHAKTSKWYKVDPLNLGFVVKSRGGAANKPRSFGYLVFPNEGRGPRNPVEQRFMERGLEKSISPILEELHELLEEQIRKELE